MQELIRFYKDTDRYKWDDYVRTHEKGTFFHLIEWKDLIEKSFGHRHFYLLAECENQIRGIFPIFSIKSFLFGKSMVSIPFAAYGGILADNNDIAYALYQKAVELVREQNLDYLEIRNENDPMPDLPGKDLYYVFKKPISGDNDENMNAVPRKARRMIRQGMKCGLQAMFGGIELLDIFYDLLAVNYQKFGTPVFSKQYFKNQLEIFKPGISILIIFLGNKPLSGVISYYFKDQVIPYYSGAYAESNIYAANDYLYWALMSDSAEKGYRIFDFGRSKKDTGPYHFKRHWGFEPQLLHYQYYLNKVESIPNLSPANPKYRRRIEMWQKLPLWATKIIGPHIVKNIP